MDPRALRAGDADRERVVALLVEHCTAGRLSLAEFEERTADVYASKTFDQLLSCLQDLPALPAPRPVVVPLPPRRSRTARFLRRPLPTGVAVLAAGVAFVLGVRTPGPQVHYVDPSSPVATIGGPAAPLPPPGARQPSNVAAARWLVADAYQQAFNADSAPERRAAAVQDSASLQAAYTQVVANYPEPARTTTVTVGGIVFVNAVEAVVNFELHYTGAGSIGQRQGRAVFLDGRWKVARETVCSVLTLGGGTC